MNLNPEKLILHGRALGGGPSIDLASRTNVGGLIVESSFMSAVRVLSQIRILPFDEFENIDKIGKVRCPVLVMHGNNDRTIPISHGKNLYDAILAPKACLWV